MKKLAIFLTSFLVFLGCATKQGTQQPQEFGKNPDVFCNLIQEPDPLLMGAWKANFVRTKGRTNPDPNVVKYRLIKQEDKYALYFYRSWKSGKKKKMEWKAWDIDGQQISGEPEFGVRIFVQDNNVYFTIRGIDEPAKMLRVEE
jgi:hypothetical protein